jgi:hypothetical protein
MDTNTDKGRFIDPETLDFIQNGAPEGERDNRAFKAACQLRDNGFSEHETLEMLIQGCEACGLGRGVAQDKVRQAFKRDKRDGCGTSRKHRGFANAHGARTPPKFKLKPMQWSEGRPLPDHIDFGYSRLLWAAFEPDEYVSVFESPSVDEKGKACMKGADGVTMLRDDWIEKLTTEGIPGECGTFIRVNPMKNGGTKVTDVDSFRHCLVEFDLGSEGNTIPFEVQYATLVDSDLPITALIHSANKSIHAWVRVDAKSPEQFKDRVETVFQKFALCDGQDESTKDAIRYSRLPDAKRPEGTQRLLAVNIGATSFEE